MIRSHLFIGAPDKTIARERDGEHQLQRLSEYQEVAAGNVKAQQSSEVRALPNCHIGG